VDRPTIRFADLRIHQNREEEEAFDRSTVAAVMLVAGDDSGEESHQLVADAVKTDRFKRVAQSISIDRQKAETLLPRDVERVMRLFDCAPRWLQVLSQIGMRELDGDAMFRVGPLRAIR